ncbi:MAG: hypothetical protein C0475_02175 [Planctomyces sp.]|nr:hypothetical protein [Planctomyces sp.]
MGGWGKGRQTMHDPASSGNDFFRCDFCRRGWSEDLPMVEGHKGSLVCSRCLSAAWVVVTAAGGVGGVGGAVAAGDAGAAGAAAGGSACTMCLEHRKGPVWESPLFAGSVICLRCVKQAARALEKDPESGWRRPGAAEGAVGAVGGDGDEEDEDDHL